MQRGPSDQVICRRFVRIGSLADFYRVCKTRGEWDRERQNIRNGVMNRNSCQTESVDGDTQRQLWRPSTMRHLSDGPPAPVGASIYTGIALA